MKIAVTYKQTKSRQLKFIDYGWNYLLGNPLRNLRDAENEMPESNLFEILHAQLLTEFYQPLLMVGVAEIRALIGKGKQICIAVPVIVKRATDAALSHRDLNRTVLIK